MGPCVASGARRRRQSEPCGLSPVSSRPALVSAEPQRPSRSLQGECPTCSSIEQLSRCAATKPAGALARVLVGAPNPRESGPGRGLAGRPGGGLAGLRHAPPAGMRPCPVTWPGGGGSLRIGGSGTARGPCPRAFQSLFASSFLVSFHGPAYLYIALRRPTCIGARGARGGRWLPRKRPPAGRGLGAPARPLRLQARLRPAARRRPLSCLARVEGAATLIVAWWRVFLTDR